MSPFCAMINKSETGGKPIHARRGNSMDSMHRIKMWIGGLTEIGMMLLALAIVAALLVGGTQPLVDIVVAHIIGLVAQLGSNGLVGLIVLGIIMWLFSHRSVA